MYYLLIQFFFLLVKVVFFLLVKVVFFFTIDIIADKGMKVNSLIRKVTKNIEKVLRIPTR